MNKDLEAVALAILNKGDVVTGYPFGIGSVMIARIALEADPVRREVIELLEFCKTADWHDVDDRSYVDRYVADLLARLKAQTND